MFTHDNVWHAIDRLAATFGYSPSGLAKQAGLDPTCFNKSKRTNPEGKERWPSMESISRILAATGATMSDFLSLMDIDAGDTPDTRGGYIPVIGFAKAGTRGYFDEDGYPVGDAWDEVKFPDNTVHDTHGTYALRVSGDSMEPLYRNGDTLVVSRGAAVRRGDRVIVRTAKGEVLAKQLIRKTPTKIELKSLNPAHEDRVIASNDVSWMARILWVSQ